jgi:undecaprenyl-diphosphatase
MSQRAIAFFRRVDAVEYRWCLQLNRSCRHPGIRRVFATVSRLGDGILWYVLALFLPITYGQAGVQPALRMAIVGVSGLAIYKYLKSRLVRERPYISLAGVIPGARALDRYSFPSGHTLHAVSFSTVVIAGFPELALLLAPFTVLIALSRVVLGLHYPTDVVAGAALGATLAATVLALPL